MNAQDVLNRARTEGIELIRFMYCDFTGVQRGKMTAIDDLANRLSHGINLTTAQMAFTLLNTIVPIEGMSPVGELRLVPDPETFTILPWMPEHASMNCDLLQKNGERYGTVMQMPATEGRLGTEYLIQAIRTGEAVPGVDPLDSLPDGGVVTQANVDTFLPLAEWPG